MTASIRMLAAFALISALVCAARAEPKCTCRALNRNFELGQSVCLHTPKGPRIAVCVTVLNNTSWQFSEMPCTGADARPSPSRRWPQPPA